MNSLKSLTFISAPPKTPNNPTFHRRERLVQRLQEQLQLAKDPSYAPLIKRWKKGEDGVKRPVDHIRRVKPWWKTDEQGFTVLTVRYGFKPIEFDRGKAPEAPSRQHLAHCSGQSTREDRARQRSFLSDLEDQQSLFLSDYRTTGHRVSDRAPRASSQRRSPFQALEDHT